jgi:hypothetical protein
MNKNKLNEKGTMLGFEEGDSRIKTYLERGSARGTSSAAMAAARRVVTWH